MADDRNAPPTREGEERRRGGFGKILIALLLLGALLLLIPLTCQALSGGDTGSGEEEPASGQATQEGAGETNTDEGAPGNGAAGGRDKDEAADPAAGEGTGTDTGTPADEEGTRQQASDQEAAGQQDTEREDTDQSARAEFASLADQSGDGTAVTVPGVVMPSGTEGWVVVHRDAGGEPEVPESIGHAPIREGQNTDIVVELDEPVTTSQTLHVMLHADDPSDGEYTFPDGDPPVEADGEPVVETFEYTVEENGEPDVLADTGGAPLLLAATVLALALLGVGAVLLRLAHQRTE